ncbi:MAG: Ppx/GppA family phosphatase [Alphaproteobacteria bacterium]|nr:Ppx/GppA family phosphatase [Alphaproteobacteria bacterium]
MDVLASSPPLPRRRRPPVLAAIDLGTNNCRLLIASPLKSGGFRVIDSFSRVVRLGEGLGRSGVLSAAAMERAVAALTICAERVRRHRRYRLRAIATEACRRAANSGELLERVKTAAGIELDIISPDEEARLAAVGCAPLMGRRHAGALLFDIGGGSTELIWLKAGAAEPVFATSVPLGVVGLAERFGEADYRTILAAVMPQFAAIQRAMMARAPFAPASHHLLGTSGTVTTLAAIALGLPRYQRGKVDASWHDCARILAIVERLSGLDLPSRAQQACIGPERADLVLPGCAIFSAIHAHWPCRRLRVADRGLREGLLRELLAEGMDGA